MAAKVIRSIVGVVDMDAALRVFDSGEDVAARESSLEATLRADATRAKAEKARAAQAKRDAEAAKPKTPRELVTALGLLFEVRDACSKKCIGTRGRNATTLCT